MNFEDDQGPQRPISSGSGSLDGKIAASPSPYPSSKRKSSSNSGDAVTVVDTVGRDVVVKPADVLCGRGKTSFNHAGNKRFRDVITASIPEYNQADSRLEKSLVVHSIVESVRRAGGRFLKEERSTGGWRALDDRACRDKVGHAIRDAATTTETRRQKKVKQEPIPGMFPSRGPISRYAEMKMDTPEPVSFHDVVHSSFTGSLFPANSRSLAIRYSGQDAQTLPSLAGVPGQQQPMGQSVSTAPGQNQVQRLTNETTEHIHHDEAGFMDQIDQVLGPMPPNHDVDPLADLLNLS